MARSKLSPIQVETIKRRLSQGIQTQEEIAREFHVSKSTIIRIKKELLPGKGESSINDKEQINALLSDYHITNPEKYQEKKLEQVRQELALFEDAEEGWTYSITKNDPDRKLNAKWFRAIVYPESAPEGWWERLKELCECACSPLHDKDKWNHPSPEKVYCETGEIIPAGALYNVGDPKKPHWHIICIFDTPMHLEKATKLIQSITKGPVVKICGTLKGAYEYFLHINDPEKYQGYEKDEIRRSAGFHIEPNSVEKAHIYQDICKVIVEDEIDSRTELIRRFGDKPDYIAQMKSGAFISGLITENWMKHNPEGRTKKVRIIKDDKE